MVEDHADIADLYQLKLQLSGYRAALATDGSTGLEMARSLRPDLVLLDIHLPGEDGLQLLAALRAEEATRDIPVIVFSDDDSSELIEEAERLGAAAYLVKARVLPSRLEQVIQSVLSSSPKQGTETGDLADRAS
jgi:two-component system response regulator AdeR